MIFNIHAMIEQVALNKAGLLLKIKLQTTRTLVLFIMNIKTEIIYKSYLRCQDARLG
jgi:hypothetical protein